MKIGTPKLNLLPEKDLVKTGDVDHGDWNFKLFLGVIMSSRFKLVKKMLAGKHKKRLLEIGYGSGVFLPELAKYADEIYGIDIHNKPAEVAEKLLNYNIKAELISSGAEKMKWKDNSFDLVVAVSALEFVSDLEAVCLEVKRILKPTGSFIIVTPGESPILDFGFKLLTGKSAKNDFADRRGVVLPMLYKHFNIKQELTYPKYLSSFVKLYTGLELNPKG
jgi:ubiquinone/menaquinone biosynthesis C-methylase UbiE